MNPLPFLLANPWRTACLVLALALAFQTARIEGFKVWPISVHGYKQQLADEKRGRKDDRDAYRAAQSEALRKAEKAKADTEAHYRDIAHDADAKADQAIADANARAQRYIRDHRVQPSVAGAPGTAAPGPDSGGAEGGNGQGGIAELVTISPADIEICTVNSMRLQAVREWALGLTAR